MECIFCQIIAGKVPSEILYREEHVVPIIKKKKKAPKHLIIIPRKHISSLTHLTEEQLPLIGHMVSIANQLAKNEGISESGYRLVINCGEQGGQLVPHLHLHLLGGRQLSDTLG